MDDFKITFLLPTCEPDEMFAHLEPSLKNIVKAREFVQFAIIFQPPYTQSEISRVIKTLNSLKFAYKYLYKDYNVVKPYTPLIRMRNDCALMYPDSDAYFLLDDDMSFEDESVVKVLNKVVTKMKADPKLDVIALNDSPRNYENFFATNAGLVYRGGKYYGFKGVVPHNINSFPGIQTRVPYEGEDLLTLFGGYQDKLCAMLRLAAGGKCDQIPYTRVKHVENRKIRGAQGHGWDPAKYKEGSVCQFILKYFNRYFLITYSMTLFEPNFMDKIHPEYFDLENNDSYLVYR